MVGKGDIDWQADLPPTDLSDVVDELSDHPVERGGYGDIYRAKHKTDGRELAIKWIKLVPTGKQLDAMNRVSRLDKFCLVR